MRWMVRNGLKGGKAGRSWKALVGYTLDDLAAHLERQFLPKMTWANMGRWHIDHILPRSMFTYETAEDEGFKACWALSNLRPLWGRDNLKKSDTRTHLL